MQVVAQQTPSAQCPFTQSASAVQVWPSTFVPQVPTLLPVGIVQLCPGAQSAWLEQYSVQAPFVQAKFPQANVLAVQTRPETVAGLRRLARGGVNADRLSAGRVGGIPGAAPLPVAHPGRSARRRVLLGTERVWLAGGGRCACAKRADLIAGLAGAATGGVAADSVGAKLRVTFGVAAAENADAFGSAASAETLDGGDTVRVAGAHRLALIGARAAQEGRADVDGPRAAGARAVADEGAGNLGALAGPRGADGAQRVEPASPFTVAGSVLTAGRLQLGVALTGVARLDAGRDRRARAERIRLRTGLAGSLAGAVAAGPLDAKLALALGGAAAREAVVSVRAAARGIRAGRPRIGRPAVGLSHDPAVTTVGSPAHAPAAVRVSRPR